jgi:hypothetical protein
MFEAGKFKFSMRFSKHRERKTLKEINLREFFTFSTNEKIFANEKTTWAKGSFSHVKLFPPCLLFIKKLLQYFEQKLMSTLVKKLKNINEFCPMPPSFPFLWFLFEHQVPFRDDGDYTFIRRS